MSMNRRAFLTWVGVGWLASSLPVAIAACSSQSTQADSSPNTGGFKSVGTVAELNKTGQLLNKNSPAGSVLVIGSSSSNLVAVNPTCTHAGCLVEWQAAPKKFHCPCHGSDFGSDGKVLKGPAAKPLKTYTAKIEGNSVLVKES